MNLPKELTAVTPLSKYLAMLVFIALPIVGFFLGIGYQEMLGLAKRQEMEANLSIPRVPTLTPLAIPTTDPQLTASWQTYRNDEFGFEVKYPKDWEVTSPFAEKTPEAVRFAKLIEREGDAAFDIIVEANPLKKPATKEWYLDWVKNIPAGIDTSKYIFEMVPFHGYQAVKVNNTELFFAKDIYMFRIRFNVSIYDPDRGFADYAKPIIDQILSTFRFIDQPISTAKNYCGYPDAQNQKIQSVWDCGDFKVLELNCCDFPDIILDKNGNKIMDCGGIGGYSEECNKFAHSPKNCSYAECKNN